MEEKTRNYDMDKTKHWAEMLMGYAKSDGKKPRKWAKIPVEALRGICGDIERARDEDLQEVCDRARGWQEDAMRVRKLLGRLAPYMEGAEEIYRRAVERAKKGGNAPELMAAAENRLQEFSTLVGEAKAEARRGQE